MRNLKLKAALSHRLRRSSTTILAADYWNSEFRLGPKSERNSDLVRNSGKFRQDSDSGCQIEMPEFSGIPAIPRVRVSPQWRWMVCDHDADDVVESHNWLAEECGLI